MLKVEGARGLISGETLSRDTDGGECQREQAMRPALQTAVAGVEALG